MAVHVPTFGGNVGSIPGYAMMAGHNTLRNEYQELLYLESEQERIFMTTYHMNDKAHQKLQVGDEDNAVLMGGAGAYDTLVAGHGDNIVLQAGTGSHQLLIVGDGSGDTLIGGSGASDTLVGGNGSCVFKAGSGAHQMLRGGTGNDIFHFLDFGADDSVDGGGGTDTIQFDNHDSTHVDVNHDLTGQIIEIHFTDISKTVFVKNIETVTFKDGKSVK